MAEYIQREALLAKVRPDDPNDKYEAVLISDVKKMVRNLVNRVPAADVAPVVHGRWEKWNGDDRHHCTVCECYANAERDSYGYIAYEFLDNYCPNCGAIMDGKQ